MKAVCYRGKGEVRVEEVPQPKILNPRDAIIRVTTTALCGSDLHLFNGVIPMMQRGDILGHEFMGVVAEVGSAVKNLQPGDRVVVPFTIACGRCFYCEKQMWSLCDNSNPNASTAEKVYGYSGSGLFGYSHMYGGYAGGQAEFVRVPYADVGPFKVPDGLNDEQVLFLSDILPTAYMAAENCNIQPGDTVAIWGAGPVGLLCVPCCRWLGAERVIMIDHIPERLELARNHGDAETINFDELDVSTTLDEMTGGRGPDCCIDAVGLEAHGHSVDAIYDRAKQAVMLSTDRIHALRQAIYCCRKGGTVSVPGVYGGFLDKLPFGSAFAKGLKFAMGQTHVHRYMEPLLKRIQGNGTPGFDPSYIISHRFSLEDAPHAYETFNRSKGDCTKVVFKTGA
jgi:threonine dehydrogenase-like Zn-dependent dehydrogenase